MRIGAAATRGATATPRRRWREDSGSIETPAVPCVRRFLGGGAGSRGAAAFEAMRAELGRTHPGCKFHASVAEVAASPRPRPSRSPDPGHRALALTLALALALALTLTLTRIARNCASYLASTRSSRQAWLGIGF